MSDFTEHPLQKLLNRENIFSQVQHLKRLIKARPSAQIARLDEISRTTGNIQIQGSLSVVNQDDGGEDIRIDDYGIFIRNQEGFIGFLSLSGTAIDDVGMYIDLNDSLTLKNAVGGKSIFLDLYDVSQNLRSYVFNYDTFTIPTGVEVSISDDLYYGSQPFHEGWFPTSDTCTQTGATTFTMPGNRTTMYSKGVKFACANPTNKYGVINTSAFVTTDNLTTVTLITNSDYALTTDSIDTPQISRFESPAGFPHWFNWSANPTGFSVQPSSPSYRWFTTANRIELEYLEANNGTSNATTFTATAPIAPVGNISAVLSATVDNGALTTTPGRVTMTSGSTLMTFRVNTATGAWTNANGKRAVVVIAYEY